MPPKFPSPVDSNFFAHINHEVYSLMMREVTVFPYSTQVTSTDAHLLPDGGLGVVPTENLYGEDMKEKWLESDSYVTPCYIASLPPWRTKVTAEGVDEDRPLTLYFDKELIEQRGKPLPAIGFLIFLQGEYYRVMEDNPTDYFANLDRAFTLICLVKRYRYESVSRGELQP